MTSPPSLRETVCEIVAATPVFDPHTHLYDPAFGDLLLWGIDELLVYHYLVAEAFRYSSLPHETFFRASKAEQADHVWKTLFLNHSPISEACRGVLTTLHMLGIDARARDLPRLRQHYRQWTPEQFIDLALETANVRGVCMTNSPFDDVERAMWEGNPTRDPRFSAGLRIDPLLLDWENSVPLLRDWGYSVTLDLSSQTLDEVRRFLADWTRRMDARYCMISLPPDFAFPDDSPTTRLLEGAIMPHGRDHGQAVALMIGVRRGVNPDLQMAGDSLGAADISALERLCGAFPENRFLCTVLSRENQHALCVAARKFRNLHIFGCWWFMNNPSLIEEVTRMRLEMLGLSFTPQHSDCRVADQLIYKWSHARTVIARVLADGYEDLAATGWEPGRAEIERDVRGLLGGSFEAFLR